MSYTDNKLLSLFATIKRPLLVLLVTIAPVMTQYAHAGTLGGSTSFSGAWGWTFSYEISKFTRANTTLYDAEGKVTDIIAAPTFDITEDIETFVTTDHGGGSKTTTGKGSALFKGKLKVTHGPAPDIGEAWAEVQMKWPEVDIIIESQEVNATHPDGEHFVYLKESRVYKVVLQNPDNAPANQPGVYADKLTDGFKRVVPGLPRNGVYAGCDGTDKSLDNYLCKHEIGYGTVAFDPTTIFQPITAASGLPVSADTGFYWDEVCLAFKPRDLGVTLDGQDFNLKEDDDGYFRSCEGRSVVFNACTPDPFVEADPVTGETIFNCNDTNGVTNEDGEHFTFILADAAAGDRLEPAPTSVCIGTNVEDWLGLEAYAGEDVVITPCDPNQGYMLFPYIFSDSEIAFTSSEGDNAVINLNDIDLQIISIGTRSELETAVVLQESADKTNSIYDFSNILLNNVSYISSLELDDTVTGSADTDVILGGNGTDRLYGFSGDDCLDGQQNDDHLWGDGHALDPSAGSRGADVFVLTSKLGKDTINDFDAAEDDVIVNISGAKSIVTDNGDDTYTVALKGQNHVTVHLAEGGSFNFVPFDPFDPVTGTSPDVVDVQNLGAYPQCSGHPAAH